MINRSQFLSSVRFGARLIERGDDADNIETFRIFGGRQLKRLFQSVTRVIGVIGDENDFSQRLRIGLRMSEEHDRTLRCPDQTSRDVAEEWMEYDFFFKRTGDDHVDLLVGEGLQNSAGRIASLVMYGRIQRQGKLPQDVAKFPRRFIGLVADVNEIEIARKTVTHPLRLREHLQETRRKSAGDGNRLIRLRGRHVESTLRLRVTSARA